jgi:hypothetical protein
MISQACGANFSSISNGLGVRITQVSTRFAPQSENQSYIAGIHALRAAV